jgi:hypothetical protein
VASEPLNSAQRAASQGSTAVECAHRSRALAGGARPVGDRESIFTLAGSLHRHGMFALTQLEICWKRA